MTKFIASFLFLAIFNTAFAQELATNETKTAATSATTGTALPDKFGGRWTTFDNRGSNLWEVKNVSGQKGTLYFWGSQNRRFCDSFDVPVSITVEESRIVVVALKSMSCGDTFRMVLTRKGTTPDFDGEITTNFFPERPEYQTLSTRVSIR